MNSCLRCGGLFYWDDSVRQTPRLVCRSCGRHTEYNPDGTALAHIEIKHRGIPVEGRIRVLHSQGVSNSKIAQRLHLNVDMVKAIISERERERLAWEKEINETS